MVHRNGNETEAEEVVYCGVLKLKLTSLVFAKNSTMVHLVLV